MERALGSKYRLGQLVGRGAMGQVFVGTDAGGNEFAFKVLRSDLTEDPGLVARFIQERSILVSLRHPNLVGVHDLVVEGDTVAIVMDLVRGGDLREFLNDAGTLRPAEVARIGSRIAAALAEVHLLGVVHRDVKPENVLMDESTAQRTPRLTDFGISRLINSSELGRSSVLAGTPQYVAPELAAGEEPTPAADLYSLGIVLYELCCGVTPFVGKSMLDVIRQHAELEPGRPDGIPQPLWEMIIWLLQKGPKARPRSAQQVATVLEAMVIQLGGEPGAPRLTAPPPGRPIAHHQLTENVPLRPAAAAGRPAASKRRGRAVFAVVGALLVLGGGGWMVSRVVLSSGATPAPGSVATSPERTPTTTPPAMTFAPDLVGAKLADARDALPTSIKITTIDTVDQESADGTVLAQDPEPGERLNGTMELTVARRAVEVYLDSLQPVSGEWSSSVRVVSLSGEPYTHAVAAGVDKCYDEPDSVDYNISKGYRRLVATGGIDDNAADSSLKMQLEIFADNRQILNTTLEYGKPSPLDVDLSGVLRLRFQWQPIAVDTSCSSGSNYLALADAKLFGLPSEVPRPTTTPTN